MSNLLSLKKEEFRSQFRKQYLQDLFKSKRKNQMLFATLVECNYDSIYFEECLDQLAEAKNLSLSDFERLVKIQMDLYPYASDPVYRQHMNKIYIILATTIDQANHQEYLKLLINSSLPTLFCEQNVHYLQFLEIYLSLAPIKEPQAYFDFIWSQTKSVNFEVVILSLYSYYFLQKEHKYPVPNHIIYSTIQLLETEFESLALRLLTLMDFDTDQQQLLQEKIIKVLFNVNGYEEEICVFNIVIQVDLISRLTQVYLFINDICSYLNMKQYNDDSLLKMLILLTKYDCLNYDSITQNLFDAVANRVLCDGLDMSDIVRTFFQNNIHLIQYHRFSSSVLQRIAV